MYDVLPGPTLECGARPDWVERQDMVWEHPVVSGNRWRGSWPKPRSPFLVQAVEARLGWCTICWTHARSGRLQKRRCTSQDPGGRPGEVYIPSGVIASGTRGTRGQLRVGQVLGKTQRLTLSWIKVVRLGRGMELESCTVNGYLVVYLGQILWIVVKAQIEGLGRGKEMTLAGLDPRERENSLCMLLRMVFFR